MFLNKRIPRRYPHVGPGPRLVTQPSTLNPQPFRCLSLWQPWATAIALCLKKIETRSWRTEYRGPIAIHAAQHWTRESSQHAFAIIRKLEDRLADSFDAYLNPFLREYRFPLGKIVAVANLVDCIPADHVRQSLTPTEELFGDYTTGRFAWMLDDITPLLQPIACTGRQGLFTLAPIIESQLPRLNPSTK